MIPVPTNLPGIVLNLLQIYRLCIYHAFIDRVGVFP